jgi:hypothetical protein
VFHHLKVLILYAQMYANSHYSLSLVPKPPKHGHFQRPPFSAYF